MVNTKIIFLFIVLVKPILAANVLYVTPIASPSHHIWNKALAVGLVEKGHNVTMLSHEVDNALPSQNFTLITMEGMYDLFHEMFDLQDFAEESILSGMKQMYDFTLFMCQYDYNTTGFKILWNYPEDFKFDVIIFDATIGRCFYPLIERFKNPPAAAVTPFLLPPALSTGFGNHLYTSYVPFYSADYTNIMTLTERIFNFMYTYTEILYRDYNYLSKEVEMVKKQFKDHIIPMDELERNVSLLLSNIDPILNYPLALPPNIIPVGGLHARPSRPLPKDLKDIMDEAKQGVILFSLGTNVRSDQLDLTMRQAFLDAFSKLPQVVLWKFESDGMESLPKNVILRKWLPQNDILGHPNTKLFISHGGALSTQEAMYHGVPVIGIPFFADQYVNIRNMEEKQIAKNLDRKKLSSHLVYEAIQDILNSKIYANNMHSLSSLYHDQPQTALERGIFWIEYLLRHGSVEHLVLPARDMPSYQTANLDVAAVLVLGLLLIYSVFVFIITGCRFIISMRRYNVKAKSWK